MSQTGLHYKAYEINAWFHIFHILSGNYSFDIPYFDFSQNFGKIVSAQPQVIVLLSFIKLFCFKDWFIYTTNFKGEFTQISYFCNNVGHGNKIWVFP